MLKVENWILERSWKLFGKDYWKASLKEDSKKGELEKFWNKVIGKNKVIGRRVSRKIFKNEELEKFWNKVIGKKVSRETLKAKEIIQTFSTVVGLTATDQPYYRFVWYFITAYGAAKRKTVVCDVSHQEEDYREWV